ncbi:hypothetical protein O0I37_01585 [Staphylococcus pseudintermedius]|nr:hypothetical protein [Staphylococcus pseudintermedius]EIK0279125.1 hypothetical protein [Staphylococcus pseudintermedius]ELV2913337.1 hypothetical protein [Staphylococcus pseudintermedius]MDE9992923.1 hypothetical protein [Staphylococcus pseudintermedius]
MKTITLEAGLKETRENKQRALNIMRSIHKKDFNYGDRTFDKPRKNQNKTKVLNELEQKVRTRS